MPRVVVDACLYSSKIVASLSYGMPIPVSLTGQLDRRHVLEQRPQADLDRHRAMGGELERVRGEVRHDLAELEAIREHELRDARIDLDAQRDLLRLGLHRQHARDLLDQEAQIERLGFPATVPDSSLLCSRSS